MIRETLFKSTAIVLQRGREAGLNSEYEDKWGFTAKKHGEGVSGWKITKRRHQR